MNTTYIFTQSAKKAMIEGLNIILGTCQFPSDEKELELKEKIESFSDGSSLEEIKDTLISWLNILDDYTKDMENIMQTDVWFVDNGISGLFCWDGQWTKDRYVRFVIVGDVAHCIYCIGEKKKNADISNFLDMPREGAIKIPNKKGLTAEVSRWW